MVDFFEGAGENGKDVGDGLFNLSQYWKALACLELAYQDLRTSSEEPGARSPSESLLPPCVKKSLAALFVMSAFGQFLSTLHFLYVLPYPQTIGHTENKEDRNLSIGSWCEISLPGCFLLPNVSSQEASF